MCPHPEASRTWPNGPMEEDLFREIIDQCVGRGVRRICPYLMAEPLTDPLIFDRIEYIRRVLGDVEIELSTTPAMLTPDNAERLLQAPITELRISSHGICDDDYRLLMPGVKFSRAWQQLNEFLDKWQQTRPYPVYIVCLFGLLPPQREREIERYWAQRNIPLQRWRVTSRAARVDLRQFDSAPDPTPWRNARGPAPYACRFDRDRQWMHILSDGRVTLCCMDYYQEIILGDLRHQSISDLWNGPAFAKVRRQILGSEPAPANFLCHRCEWYVSRSFLDRRRSAASAARAGQ